MIRVRSLAVAVLFSLAAAAQSATFTVENTDNSGPGSLRQAIEDYNLEVGPDQIVFNIPTNGPHTIQPTAPLPEITDSGSIDGFTQGSMTPNPADDAIPNSNPIDQAINAVLKIEIDGSNAGLDASGLRILADDVTIRGLVINRFDEEGIFVMNAVDILVEGCFIGTSVDGLADLGNGRDGIRLSGVLDSRVGGSEPRMRNLLSGNSSDGVRLRDGSSENRVQGNFIGVDATGNAALGNVEKGVRISDATSNRIGGILAQERNILSGNNGHGLFFANGAVDNLAAGNYIGTNRTGTAAVPNLDDGVLIFGGSNNQLGNGEGATPGEGCSGGCNLISGNIQEGVVVGGGASEYRIRANYIGTDVTGTNPLPNNFNGIFIFDGASGTFVGGVEPALGNVIAFNGDKGVAIPVDADNGHTILGNSIHSNGGLGIDLNNNGVTNNDNGPPPDQDNGANNLQNFPVLTSATVQGGETHIEGSLRSLPNSDFRVECFSNAECDPTTNGEGRTSLGFHLVSTDPQGLAPIDVSLSVTVAGGDFITSTATLRDGPTSHSDTSEFSDCIEAIAEECPAILPDFDGSGRVNSIDLLQYLRDRTLPDPPFDLNCDNEITSVDLFQFSVGWYVEVR